MLARRALRRGGGAGLLLLVLLAVLNAVVDPYAVFGLVSHPRINGDRLELHTSHSALYKEFGVIAHKPEYLMLGSSVVDNAFRLPGNASFSYEPREKNQAEAATMKAALPDADRFYPGMFNASVRGGGVSEAYRMLQHAYANNPNLKRVIAGFEYNLFTTQMVYNQVPSSEAANKTYIPLSLWGSLLFSSGVTADSMATLSRNSSFKFIGQAAAVALDAWKAVVPDAKAAYTQIRAEDLKPNPRWWAAEGALIQPQDARETSWVYFVLHNMTYQHRALINGQQTLLTDYSMRDIAGIKTFSQSHNIEFQLFINSHPPFYWAAARAYGIEPYIDRWLRELAAISPFYAFTESVEYSSRLYEYFGEDPLHYQPVLGTEIFQVLWYRKPENGPMRYTMVTKDNVDAFIARRKSLLDRWLAARPYYRELLAMKPGFAGMPATYHDIAPRGYDPVVNGLRVIKFMEKFYALPAEQAPYDLLRVLKGQYKPFYKADSLPDLVVQINAASAK